MKEFARYLAICLLASCALWAQGGQNSNHGSQSGSQGDTSPSNDRPTLGPRTGPGLDTGPLTSTTSDIRKLLRIHTLYIEDIDNSLNEKLMEELGGWGRFRLVVKEKNADAVLRGTCLESRHLKRMHSEIFISDQNGKSIWQDTIYRPYSPPSLDQAVDDTARVVLAHLQQSIRQAERQ